jgi:hypothetical protein
MVTVACKEFSLTTHDPAFSSVIEAFGIVASKLGNKCLGCLTCVVQYELADRSSHEVCIKVLGVSGNGGKDSKRVSNLMMKHFSGEDLCIAPAAGSRTIYAKVEGRTVIDWEPDFLTTLAARMEHEAAILSKDVKANGGLSVYSLENFKEASRGNVMCKRIQTELDWTAHFTTRKKMVADYDAKSLKP